jgi:hypothetical protein
MLKKALNQKKTDLQSKFANSDEEKQKISKK